MVLFSQLARLPGQSCRSLRRRPITFLFEESLKNQSLRRFREVQLEEERSRRKGDDWGGGATLRIPGGDFRGWRVGIRK